jgi:hypothetical protein
MKRRLKRRSEDWKQKLPRSIVVNGKALRLLSDCRRHLTPSSIAFGCASRQLHHVCVDTPHHFGRVKRHTDSFKHRHLGPFWSRSPLFLRALSEPPRKYDISLSFGFGD